MTGDPYHVHCCECGVPVMEESVGAWQQERIRKLAAAPRAATEPPTPADFDAMSPEEFDAYLVRNGMDARIKTALAEPVTEPLTRERLAAALRHVAETEPGTLAHADQENAGPGPEYAALAILEALTSTSAPEPGS